jgi:hypothetical protein
MTCSGNSAEVCGGPNLVSVYSIASPPPMAPVAAILKTGLPGTWTYVGCYADGGGNRDLGFAPVGIEIDSNTENTAQWCLSQCTAQGYNAAGTEYSSQCCKYRFLFHMLAVKR